MEYVWNWKTGEPSCAVQGTTVTAWLERLTWTLIAPHTVHIAPHTVHLRNGNIQTEEEEYLDPKRLLSLFWPKFVCL